MTGNPPPGASGTRTAYEIPEMMEHMKGEVLMSETIRESDVAKAAAVKRLRGSKKEAGYEDYRQGIQDGEHWAAHLASYRQLAALEDVADEFWDRSGKRTNEDSGNDIAWALALRLQLRFGEVHAPSQMKTILFPGPERRRSPAYVSGFVLGIHGMAQAVNQPAKPKKAAG